MIESQGDMRIWALVLGLAGLPSVAAAISFDSPLPAGLYVLGSHPDGSQGPPLYGLRLDGLDGDPSHEFTFDFDGPGAAMRMDLADGGWSAHLFGTAYGGRDVGSSYESPQLFSIDFTYSRMIVDGDRLVADPTTFPNTGTITPLEHAVGSFAKDEAIDLQDYFGEHPFTFILEENHRGASGFSGFGWMNHGGGGLENHVQFSDWLYTVIPEPSRFVLLLAGVGLLGLVRWRLLRARHPAPPSPVAPA